MTQQARSGNLRRLMANNVVDVLIEYQTKKDCLHAKRSEFDTRLEANLGKSLDLLTSKLSYNLAQRMKGIDSAETGQDEAHKIA